MLVELFSCVLIQIIPITDLCLIGASAYWWKTKAASRWKTGVTLFYHKNRPCNVYWHVTAPYKLSPYKLSFIIIIIKT